MDDPGPELVPPANAQTAERRQAYDHQPPCLLSRRAAGLSRDVHHDHLVAWDEAWDSGLRHADAEGDTWTTPTCMYGSLRHSGRAGCRTQLASKQLTCCGSWNRGLLLLSRQSPLPWSLGSASRDVSFRAVRASGVAVAPQLDMLRRVVRGRRRSARLLVGDARQTPRPGKGADMRRSDAARSSGSVRVRV